MKSVWSSYRVVVPVFLAVFLLGCFATAAQWMTYVMVDPDALNEVMQDADGNVVHVSLQGDGVHVATYNGDGVILQESISDITLGTIKNAVQLPNQQLLLVGNTLATSWVVDANSQLVSPLDTALLAAGTDTRTITGAKTVLGNLTAVYGSHESLGWVLLIDFAAQSSQLLDVAPAQSVNQLFGYQGLVMEVTTATGRKVVSYDSGLNELGRFGLSSGNDRLIGDSLGRPVLFNSSSHDVRALSVTGENQWTYVNAELETVDGQSVGPDGSVVLWGDGASLNPLLGVTFDSAHLLRIDADGLFQYHYQGGDSMVNILYTNVKQFDDGMVQMSFQGWTGQLAGFVIGSNLGTPFTVTRQVFHDFITPLGKKTRWMLEPKRVETYSQCGTICVSLIDQSEGHCDNLDVFNIDQRSLISVSQVCGAVDEAGLPLTDVVTVTRF